MHVSQDTRMQINDAMQLWSQGSLTLRDDIEFVHVANLTQAHSQSSLRVSQVTGGEAVSASLTAIMDSIPGIVVVSQTCDVRRDCYQRPFVEVAPLVCVSVGELEDIRRLRKPSFAYIPAVAEKCFVADLDRIMTVEKAVIAAWTPVDGPRSDQECRDFGNALARKWSRVALPDDFVSAASRLRTRFLKKYRKNTSEGAHLRALREIRVSAAPSWNDAIVELTWWFIREQDPEGFPANWASITREWMSLFEPRTRFETIDWIACRLDDLTARDYVESDRLDLDQLSV